MLADFRGVIRLEVRPRTALESAPVDSGDTAAAIVQRADRQFGSRGTIMPEHPEPGRMPMINNDKISFYSFT